MPQSKKVIGVDESGKGDFFGPLVIASFYAEDDDTIILRSLGVKDGKSISEKKILQIDEDLRADFKYSVRVIYPEEYNRLYKKIKNLNILLAEGHAHVIDDLSQRCDAELAISDKFGKSELIEDALEKRKNKIELRQFVKGESYIQVAAASILARAAFINAMYELSEKIGFDLPRGAAPLVDKAGRELVAERGDDILEKVGKLHFKNYKRITDLTLF